MKKPAAATPETPAQQAAATPRSTPRRRTSVKAPASVQASPVVTEVATEAVIVEPVIAATSASNDKKKKKTKVVRDSFTMPKSDYDKIAELKKKSLDAGINIKKSELLRAGLLALEAMPLSRLKTMLAKVESIKTGRPSSKAD